MAILELLLLQFVSCAALSVFPQLTLFDWLLELFQLSSNFFSSSTGCNDVPPKRLPGRRQSPFCPSWLFQPAFFAFPLTWPGSFGDSDLELLGGVSHGEGAGVFTGAEGVSQDCLDVVGGVSHVGCEGGVSQEV